MAAANVPRSPWCPTPGAEAFNNQPTHCATGLSLKLKKISLLLIIRLFSVWHNDTDNATMMQLQAMTPAAAVDHLRPFRRNRFVLWTYWRRPVAQFRWRQRGRQSENGRGGGDFGLASTMILLHRWEPLGVVDEFGNATAGRMPSCVLSLRGAGVEGSRGTRGIRKVSRHSSS
jgi:hypothetical protein